MAGLQKKDLPSIEQAVNSIDSEIPPETIPEEDHPLIAKARDLIAKLKQPKKPGYFQYF